MPTCHRLGSAGQDMHPDCVCKLSTSQLRDLWLPHDQSSAPFRLAVWAIPWHLLVCNQLSQPQCYPASGFLPNESFTPSAKKALFFPSLFCFALFLCKTQPNTLAFLQGFPYSGQLYHMQIFLTRNSQDIATSVTHVFTYWLWKTNFSASGSPDKAVDHRPHLENL